MLASGSDSLNSGTWHHGDLKACAPKIVQGRASNKTYFVQEAWVDRICCFILWNTFYSAVICVPIIVTILNADIENPKLNKNIFFLPSKVTGVIMTRIGNEMPNQWWHCSRKKQKMRLILHRTPHLGNRMLINALAFK